MTKIMVFRRVRTITDVSNDVDMHLTWRIILDCQHVKTFYSSMTDMNGAIPVFHDCAACVEDATRAVI